MCILGGLNPLPPSIFEATGMTTLSAEAAIDLLLSDPAKYATSESLRNMAAQAGGPCVEIRS